jgi:hypothetical protein
MADELTTALSGLEFNPLETDYGIVTKGLASALPSLINPYGSVGSNLGIALGGTLLTSLLGYQARKEAFDLGLQTQQYANQMSALTTPEARTDFLAALPSEAVSSGIGGRLSALSRALGQQEASQKAMIGQEVAKREALAKFELGDLGTQLYERDIQKKIREYGALRSAQGGGKSEKDWFETLSKPQQDAIRSTRGKVSELRALAQQFRDTDATAIGIQAGRQVAGSKVDLAMSKMDSLVPTVARLMGEVGNLSIFDQEQMIKATVGGRLSGSQSIAARLDQLATAAERMSLEAMKTAKLTSERGGDALIAAMEGRTDTTPPPLAVSPQDQLLLSKGFTRGPNGGWIPPR